MAAASGVGWVFSSRGQSFAAVAADSVWLCGTLFLRGEYLHRKFICVGLPVLPLARMWRRGGIVGLRGVFTPVA
jgi:hypothetical protein